MWRRIYRKWSFTPLNIQTNSTSSACNLQREYSSMDHQAVVRLLWPKQLPMNVHLTSSVSRDPSSWLCGSESLKLMWEMSLIRQEEHHLVSCSSMSLIQLEQPEEVHRETQVEQVTECSTSSWLKWMELVQRKTCSSLEPLTDLTFLMKPLSDLVVLTNWSISHSQISHQELLSSRQSWERVQLHQTLPWISWLTWVRDSQEQIWLNCAREPPKQLSESLLKQMNREKH